MQKTLIRKQTTRRAEKKVRKKAFLSAAFEEEAEKKEVEPINLFKPWFRVLFTNFFLERSFTFPFRIK